MRKEDWVCYVTVWTALKVEMATVFHGASVRWVTAKYESTAIVASLVHR